MRSSTSPFRVPLLIAVFIIAVLACSSILPAQVPFPTEDPHLDIPRVSLADAKAAFDSGAAVFVDVRGSQSYAASHIPGAISLPGDEIESRLDEFDPEEWIITYCT